MKNSIKNQKRCESKWPTWQVLKAHKKNERENTWTRRATGDEKEVDDWRHEDPRDRIRRTLPGAMSSLGKQSHSRTTWLDPRKPANSNCISTRGLSPFILLIYINAFCYFSHAWPSRSAFHAHNSRNDIFRIDTFLDLGSIVRTLRVPARRLGALIRGVSLDVRKVPHGDHFGIKN